MSNEIKSNTDLLIYDDEKISLIKRTIAKDATDDELKLFLHQCKRTGLDPIVRQIYFIKDNKGKVTVCSSIDGLRLVAERSDKYEGQTKAEFCGPDGIWKDIWLDKQPPSAARIGVWKKGFREATYATAIFNEYAGRKYTGELTFMWAKMPAMMIAKVAEALALRKAFPNDLSGLYSSEEAEIISGNEQKQPSIEQKQPEVTRSSKDVSTHTQSAVKDETPISASQRKELFNLANNKQLVSSLQSEIRNRYGVESTEKLKVWQFQEIMSLMEGM